jgi:hypothetical protein
MPNRNVGEGWSACPEQVPVSKTTGGTRDENVDPLAVRENPHCRHPNAKQAPIARGRNRSGGLSKAATLISVNRAMPPERATIRSERKTARLCAATHRITRKS